MGFLRFLKRVFGIFLILLLFFTIVPMSANALVFGGRILNALPCLNGGLAISIGPPRPGFFLWQTGLSTTYREYQVRPGPWAIGAYTPFGICLIPGPPPFFIPIPIPTQGTVRQIGTSF